MNLTEFAKLIDKQQGITLQKWQKEMIITAMPIFKAQGLALQDISEATGIVVPTLNRISKEIGVCFKANGEARRKRKDHETKLATGFYKKKYVVPEKAKTPKKQDLIQQSCEETRQILMKMRVGKHPSLRYNSEEKEVLKSLVRTVHEIDSSVGAQTVADYLGVTYRTVLRVKHELGLIVNRFEQNEVERYVSSNAESDYELRKENRFFSIHIMGANPNYFGV